MNCWGVKQPLKIGYNRTSVPKAGTDREVGPVRFWVPWKTEVHLSRQLVPIFHQFYTTKVVFYVYTEFPVFQFVLITPCFYTECYREEFGSVFFTTASSSVFALWKDLPQVLSCLRWIVPDLSSSPNVRYSSTLIIFMSLWWMLGSPQLDPELQVAVTRTEEKEGKRHLLWLICSTGWQIKTDAGD